MPIYQRVIGRGAKRIERWLATTRGGVVLVVLGCLFLLFYAIVYAALEGVL